MKKAEMEIISNPCDDPVDIPDTFDFDFADFEIIPSMPSPKNGN